MRRASNGDILERIVAWFVVPALFWAVIVQIAVWWFR